MDWLTFFTGDIGRYRHPLNPKVIYTEGIHYMANQFESYWLVDAIASYFGDPSMDKAIADDARLQTFQFWTLTKHKDQSATLICQADSDVEPAITQRISFTDFPMDQMKIWVGYDGQYWTIYLPSEH